MAKHSGSWASGVQSISGLFPPIFVNLLLDFLAEMTSLFHESALNETRVADLVFQQSLSNFLFTDPFTFVFPWFFHLHSDTMLHIE